MRFRIHRGAREIGGSCVEVEAEGRSLLIDLGLPLSAEAADPSLLPAVPGLRDGGSDRLLGILLSHSHRDHMGLVGEAHPEIPVYMGEHTRRLITAAAPFLPKSPVPPIIRTYSDRVPISLGPFTITPYLADHSGFDSYGLLIAATDRRLFYSGDFRSHGRKGRLFEQFVRSPPRPIHTLLLEGTNIGRSAPGATATSETDLEDQITSDLMDAPGLVLACFSAQNIDRFVTFYRAALRANRAFVGDAYLANILAAIDLPSLPRTGSRGVRLFLPAAQKRQIVRSGRFELIDPFRAGRIYPEHIRAAPRNWAMLFRPSMMEDIEKLGLPGRLTLLYAQWPGYLDCPDQALRGWCGTHKVRLLFRHTSGHADRTTLARMAKALSPTMLVPIHTDVPERYFGMFERVSLCPDGVWQAV